MRTMMSEALDVLGPMMKSAGHGLASYLAYCDMADLWNAIARDNGHPDLCVLVPPETRGRKRRTR